MNVKYWTSAGKIKSSKIDVDELVANMADINLVHLGHVWIDTLDIGDGNNDHYIMVNGTQMKVIEAEIGGKQIIYLGQEPY